MPEAYLSIAIAHGHDVCKAINAEQLLGQRSSSGELPTVDLSASAAYHQLLLPNDATDVGAWLEQDGEELCQALQCLFFPSCGESFETLSIHRALTATLRNEPIRMKISVPFQRPLMLFKKRGEQPAGPPRPLLHRKDSLLTSAGNRRLRRQH